jgi:hypothetical protein
MKVENLALLRIESSHCTLSPLLVFLHSSAIFVAAK